MENRFCTMYYNLFTKSFTSLFFLLCLANVGCAPGLIYTDVTSPLCTNMRKTSLGLKRGSGSSKQLRIPYSSFDLTSEWDSRAIGIIAKNNNLGTVKACDKRLVSVLGGIFRKSEVIIYGD
jgi:hypothetical protein